MIPSLLIGLVSPSAILSWVAMYSTSSCLVDISSLQNIYFTSICFVLCVIRLPFAILIVDWLSTYILIGSLILILTSFSMFRIQSPSFNVKSSATSSASVELVVTSSYRFEFQAIGVPLNVQMLPVVDRLVDFSSAKSESENPITVSSMFSSDIL